MAGIRRTDTDPGWIQRRFRDLERRLNEQAAAKRLAGTEVPEGGNFLVRGLLSVIGTLTLTGTLSMKHADGSEAVRLGDMPLADKGLEFIREDGVPAFTLRKEFVDTNPQSWALYDAAGVAIVAEQSLFGGLSKPFLEMPFQPVAPATGTAVTCGPYGLERTTASTSWTTLFVHSGKQQNQGVDLKVAVLCSDSTTACEVRAINAVAGTQLGSFILPQWTGVVAASSPAAPAWTVLDPNTAETMIVEFDTLGVMSLGIQVRRTAGTGSITLSVVQSIGG